MGFKVTPRLVVPAPHIVRWVSVLLVSFRQESQIIINGAPAATTEKPLLIWAALPVFLIGRHPSERRTVALLIGGGGFGLLCRRVLNSKHQSQCCCSGMFVFLDAGGVFLCASYAF